MNAADTSTPRCESLRCESLRRESLRGRRVSVYGEAPGFRRAPRALRVPRCGPCAGLAQAMREGDASACMRRHKASALAPVH